MRLEELRCLEWADVDLENREIMVRSEKLITIDCKVNIPSSTATTLRELGIDNYRRLSPEKQRELLNSCMLSNSEFAEFSKANHNFAKLDDNILAFSYIRKWSPKSTGRRIPISDGLAKVLFRQPRSANLVFPDPEASGLWRLNTIFMVKRCAVHAKIQKNIHTHTLRHTFATQLRRSGVALETIKELLGHADIRHTLIYAHFSPAEARAAIPKIDFF